MIGLAGILFLATVGGVMVGAAVRASAAAATAADLGALAGAEVLSWHSGDACVRAGAVVGANHAAMTRCEVDGVDLRVWVEVGAPVVSAFGAGHARARAGPVRRPTG